MATVIYGEGFHIEMSRKVLQGHLPHQRGQVLHNAGTKNMGSLSTEVEKDTTLSAIAVCPLRYEASKAGFPSYLVDSPRLARSGKLVTETLIALRLAVYPSRGDRRSARQLRGGPPDIRSIRAGGYGGRYSGQSSAANASCNRLRRWLTCL